MNIKPADIIITTDNNSLFSKAILLVLNFFQKDEVRYQHAMLAVNEEVCIEALNKITFSYTRDRMKDFKRFKIIRHKNITDDQRKAIVQRAITLHGRSYGYIRLFLQLLDQTFHTNYFTKRIKNPTYQICSSLVAWCYDVETGVRINGLSWASVEPDDFEDCTEKNPNIWEVVLEWSK